ncbi:Uncharacterised protein [Mycobacteroides abscessus subsp. abscessus]|nr:Uncharacterised protein [Mycobacteroides abscessus subsp. abscessus]SKP32184.1 Uncharacterised protein [Mycobacteroides abscessus subsp. massiliense]
MTGSGSSAATGARIPLPASRASRDLTRRNNWPAALRVNVNPST